MDSAEYCTSTMKARGTLEIHLSGCYVNTTRDHTFPITQSPTYTRSQRHTAHGNPSLNCATAINNASFLPHKALKMEQGVFYALIYFLIVCI